LVVASVSSGVILVGGLGGESLARVDRQVSDAWRPAYDLLLLPQGADVYLDLQGTRAIEANFMAALDGGISIDQWESVLGVRGVEVAAPIATVGSFKRDLPQFFFPQLKPGFYQIERVVSWDNGVDVRRQTVSVNHGVTLTRPRGDLPYVPKTRVHLYCCPRQLVTDKDYGLSGADFDVSGFRNIDTVYYEDEEAWDPLRIDPGGTFLVYGVDPEQENKLVGLIDAARGSIAESFENAALTPGTDFCGATCIEGNRLPLLVNDRGWIETNFSIRFRRWKLPELPPGGLAARAGPCPRRYKQELGTAEVCFPPNLRRDFAAAGTEEALSTTLPLDDDRLGGKMSFRGGRWRRSGGVLPDLGFPWLARAAPIHYRVLDDYPQGPWLGAVEAVPTGSYGPEPTFRDQLPPPEPFLMEYNLYGKFDGATIARKFEGQGNWLPEDTYRPPRAIRRFGLDGRRVEPSALRPTANPLGYLLEPPRALTTLTAAAELLGERPISAIRVRVEGVDEPGEEAWTRVENAARRIKARTGLEPIVTLGSSPARVLVKVPGIDKDEQPSRQAWRFPNSASQIVSGGPAYQEAPPSRSVEGFGWVEEPWLTEGAAISYLRAGAAQHLWLLVTLLGASLVYLVAAFGSLGLSGIHTVAVRRALGWPRRLVFLTEMRRAAWLGLAGALGGVVLGAGVAALMDLPLRLGLAPVAIPAALVVACGAAALPAWRSSSVPAARVLAGGEIALFGEGAGRLRPSAGTIVGLAASELLRLRSRALLAVAASVVATASLFILVGTRQDFAGALQVTVLGQAILLKTGPLQTATTVVSGILAVALMGEILWQSVLDRRQDIGVLRAVGWAKRQVSGLMVSQGILLGTSCALIGASIASALVFLVVGSQATVIIAVGSVASLGGGAILGLVASAVPAWLAARERPAEVLRST
jgi:hypothetical protein